MSEYILVVDDTGTLKTTCEQALHGCDVRMLSCQDIGSAKRKLIQAIPCIILCTTSINNDDEAGFSFCRDLQGHSEFSKIPVVLVFEGTSRDLSLLNAKASSVGASVLLHSSVSPLVLRRLLHKTVPAVVAEPPSLSPENEQAIQREDDAEAAEKLRLAQHLLAKVLHNFKTSDLLHVIEKEDIPQVIFGITRTVCGIKAEEPKKPGDTETVASSENDDYVDVDLDSAFGLKK